MYALKLNTLKQPVKKRRDVHANVLILANAPIRRKGEWVERTRPLPHHILPGGTFDGRDRSYEKER